METESLRTIFPLLIIGGVPITIYLARHERISRIAFAKYLLIAILLFFAGIILGDKVHPIFRGLMMLAGWVMYYGLAQRLNDIGYGKWRALWAVIPIVLIVFIPQGLFQKKNVLV